MSAEVVVQPKGWKHALQQRVAHLLGRRLMTMAETMVRDLPINSIHVSDANVRKTLDVGEEDSSLGDLAESIRQHGLLSPVIVRESQDHGWELVAGQRRLLACRRLGWETIPAILRTIGSDSDATVLSLIENVHRADMAPLDKARAFTQLLEVHGSVAGVARATGVSAPTISRYIDLMRLPDSLQERLSTKDGPVGVEALSTLARTFNSPSDAEEAYELVGGFRAGVQAEILKLSEGSLDRLTQLAEDAREGLFNTVTCHDGLCPLLDDDLKRLIASLTGRGARLTKDRLKTALGPTGT